jgi:hypothetical protein
MKVSELKGPLLDYWVARAEGKKARIDGDKCIVETEWEVDEYSGTFIWYRPSFKWDIGGPIIERERMLLVPRPDGGWSATTTSSDRGWGDTALEAAMRCFVASRFGVNVPDQIEEENL